MASDGEVGGDDEVDDYSADNSYPIILGIGIWTGRFVNGLVYMYSQSIHDFVQLIYKWTKFTPRP